MQYKSIKYYIGNLIREGHKWQSTDINGNPHKPRFYFSFLQWFFILASGTGAYFVSTGFSKDFIGYIISVLSIFVGLFLTLMLSVFDKFKQMNYKGIKEKIDKGELELNEQEEIRLIQRKNYFRQFTSLTSYSILISITCILLLSICLLTDFFTLSITKYHFVGWDNINSESLLTFGKTALIWFYRAFILYFLLDFLLIVIFAVTSIYSVFTLDFDEAKIR